MFFIIQKNREKKMKLEEFKKKTNKKRVSKLQNFKYDILNLYDNNYSLQAIQKYLLQKGVKTTFQNIAKFIKKEQGREVDRRDDNDKKFKKLIKKDVELKVEGHELEQEKSAWGVKFDKNHPLYKDFMSDF